MTDVERLLRSALIPIEPPEGMTDRMERRLTELTDAAAGELAEFDAEALRDPRNWVRPVVAAGVVGMAGGALVLVRARQRSRKREAKGLRALEQSLADVAGGVLRRFER
jgi:hypothetical protein